MVAYNQLKDGLAKRERERELMVQATSVAAVLFLVLYITVWGLCLLGWRTARHRYDRPLLPPSFYTSQTSALGITVIRPLCGLDTNLYNALEATMKLDYPRYEVLFSVQDSADESLPVVRMIMDKYPHVDARVIIERRDVGVNPKVNNLMAPFEEAKYDLLWVVDATISVSPGTLGRAVDAFIGSRDDLESTMAVADGKREPPQRGDVGLIHQVPFAVVHQKTWGSLVEQAFLNTTHAKMYLAINALSIDSCVIGKANMYSRANVASLTSPSPTLRKLPNPPTGLQGFSPFLAEDNMVALSLWHELGLRHAMTADVALDFIGGLSIRDYVQRRVRWIRVRKRMTPIAVVLLEPFTESLLSGFCGSWAMSHLFGTDLAAIFALHMVLWMMIDFQVAHALKRNVIGTRLSLMAWVMREVMTLPIWLYGVSGSTVTWRGKGYRVLASGEASLINDVSR